MLAFQGASHCVPRAVKALLQKEIIIKKRGIPNLKNAVLHTANGKLHVTPLTDHTKPSNAAIYIPANRRKLRKGEHVTTHFFEGQYQSL